MRQDFLIIQQSPEKSYDLGGNEVLIDKPKNYIEECCLSLGASLKGRNEAVFKCTNINYKLPIVLSNKEELYYLLTRSINAKDCILINYRELLRYKQINDEQVLLIFRNGFTRKINTNYRIIKRQIAILEKYLNNYYQKCYNH